MRRSVSALSLLMAAALWAAPGRAQLPPDIEQAFDAAIDPAEMDGWMRTMAAEPNHVGSAHDKANAEATLARFRSWGWDAKIETFQVLYPTPLEVALALVGPKGFKATLTEKPVQGDATSSRTRDQLPAYVAFQGDGDVTAPLVYVNYGMPDDYKALERMGFDVRGKIVIARYGAGWRGLKPKLAQGHGAVGCIIYSDPRDDGFSVDDVYPKGAARPSHGFQRGSVADMTLHPGDPLTPGVGATADAKRLTRDEAATILEIPTLPISYGDAERLLAALAGRVAPDSWRGGLGITYHVGGTDAARVHMRVRSDWTLKPAYNVVAVMSGSEFPDQWVLRGNHHDGWVFGASDPLSGHVAMMAEAKAIGALRKTGWRPRPTLVYLSWDAEEPMLLGSTEWVETHAEELKHKGLVYINTDGNGRGFLGVGGSHALQNMVGKVAADVTDPQTGVSVDARRRAGAMIRGETGGERAKAAALAAADAARDLPLDPLGSGSDYSSFLQHLGLAALHVGYGGEGESGGVYHSAYDTWEHHSRFVDPGFAYAGALAKTAGRMVLRMSEADLPLQRYGDFADTVSGYLDEVKQLADDKRAAQVAQATLIEGRAYQLTDDPTLSSGPPTPLAVVPYFNLAPLDNAMVRLEASAKAYDKALREKGAGLAPAVAGQLVALAGRTEQALAVEEGLPGGRGWYKNMVYAPGQFTGYGAKTLPGVREAIEDERWADVDRYAGLTARALNAYADRLDQGLALLGVSASPAADLASRIDAVFAEYDKEDSPGCALAVVQDGVLRHARGYGMASLEHAVPIAPQTVFDIGSTSKQVTAASILLLVQDGQLALDDDVRRHVPELPDHGTRVTVNHLLHHTSGIRDYINLLALSGVDSADVATDEDALGILARQTSLDFPPGSEHSYSNSGYFLLSQIVERVSGKALADFAKERIFDPLGMERTLILDDHARVIPGRATGYDPRPEGGFAVNMSDWEQTGDGAVNTTVLDLARWDANFYHPKVGGRWLVEQLQRVGTLDGGTKLEYARGLVVDDYRGIRRVQHGGSWAGFRAQMMRFPEQKLTTIVLCNVGSANTSALAQGVADLYLTGMRPEPQAAAAPAAQAVAPDELERYAGLYWSPTLDLVRTLAVRDGKLVYVRGPGNATELAPLAEGRFAMLAVPGPTELIFQPSKDGKRSFHLLTAANTRPTVFEEVAAAAPAAEDLAVYAGTYASEELDTTWRLVVDEGRLTVDAKRGHDFPLEPAFADAFGSPAGLLRFERDAQQQVTGFHVGAGRARNILFTRAAR